MILAEPSVFFNYGECGFTERENLYLLTTDIVLFKPVLN